MALLKRAAKSHAMVSAVAVLGAALAFAAPASAKTQLNLAAHFGGEVNENGSDVCLAGEACQPGSLGESAGWFRFPDSVAVDQETHDIYVADNANQRVDKLGSNGQFVLMWGWNVNQEGGNTCTNAEESKCQAGEAGTGLAGQMYGLYSVAVDQETHDVYVLDYFYHRVDEFEQDGKFVLMFGGDVNSNGTNVCVAAEASKCQSGTEGSAAGFFEFPQFFGGSMLAVGGPNKLVYVADKGRVQEFDTSGAREGELSLSSAPFHPGNYVTGLAVDGLGDTYVTESHGWYPNQSNSSEVAPPGVYEFNAEIPQKEIAEFDSSSEFVEAMALDPSGRLTVIEGPGSSKHGVLYNLSGARVSTFGERAVQGGLSYDEATGDLYSTLTSAQEVNVFEPVITPEPITGPPKEVQATSATLTGEVSAEESPQTSPPSLPATSFFEYGRCAPGATPNTCAGHPYDQTVPTTPTEETGLAMVPVEAPVAGLYPNQLYHYRLAATNKNTTTEASEGEPVEFTTKALPPAIESAPSAPFVRSESAVLSASLNPENATTSYRFEYGPCEPVSSCAQATPAVESSIYGEVGVTQEVMSLTPSTVYHFRLVAVNEYGETTKGPEVAFQTGPAPTPEAVTGSAGAVTSTGAVIAGTVNPDGEPAVYVFEIGVYDGARTHFGIVLTGSAGGGTSPVPESLALSGLQPGTEYAYRIAIKSSYGEAIGATGTFTTQGVSALLTPPMPLAMLPTPPIGFPASPKAVSHAGHCKGHKKRLRHGKCIKLKKKIKARTRHRSGSGSKARRGHATKTFKGGM